jgi:hypothetical protein
MGRYGQKNDPFRRYAAFCHRRKWSSAISIRLQSYILSGKNSIFSSIQIWGGCEVAVRGFWNLHLQPTSQSYGALFAKTKWLRRVNNPGSNCFYMDVCNMSRLAKALTLLTCIREVPASILGLDTGYPEYLVFFLSLSTYMSNDYHILNHDHFLPHPLQMITSNHPIIRRCIVRTTDSH